MVGVVVTGARALLGLGRCRADQLTHLGGHQRAEPGRLGLQDVAGAPQDARAVRDGPAAPALERGRGGRQLRLDGGGSMRLEHAQAFARRGIDTFDCHEPNLTHDHDQATVRADG
jgi:hypothetical protein